MSEILASLTNSNFCHIVAQIVPAMRAFNMITVVGFVARVIYKKKMSVSNHLYYVFGFHEQLSVATSAARGPKGAPIAWLIPRSAIAERKVARKCMLSMIYTFYKGGFRI